MPSVVMIHGFRGTHHGLELIKKSLGSASVIVPDLPGFAAGDKLKTYDLNAYVTWLHALIQKQPQPPILLGHSFGSIICAAYAAKYPDTINRLVLVNPIGAPALEGPRIVLSKLAVFYYWIGKKLPEKAGKRWLASKVVVMLMSITMAKTKDKKLRRFIHDQHLRYFSRFHSAKSVAEGFETSIKHSVRDFARDITVPTLLIAGEKDDITPLHKQRQLVQLFPGASLQVIKGVGHLTHYETPDQVARLIHDFIKSA